VSPIRILNRCDTLFADGEREFSETVEFDLGDFATEAADTTYHFALLLTLER